MEVLELLGFKKESELFAWVAGIYMLVTKGRSPRGISKDDLIAEGLMAVVQLVKKYDPKRKDSFRAYAYIRARGAMLDLLRLERRHTQKVCYYIDSDLNFETKIANSDNIDWDTPEESCLRKQQQRILKSAMSHLSLLEQKVVLQRHIHGLNFEQIRKICGKKTRSSTHKIHKKALKRLFAPIKQLGLQLNDVA